MHSLLPFPNVNIPQGSVATHLRCGGTINDDYIAMSMKETFTTGLSYGQK